MTSPRILPAWAEIAKSQHYFAPIHAADWLSTRQWVLVSYQTLYPTMGTGVRGSAKPLLEDLVMQPSHDAVLLGCTGVCASLVDILSNQYSSLKLCWLSCHCKSTPVEHTSVPGWQVWEQCQAKVAYVLEVTEEKLSNNDLSSTSLESPVQCSSGESKIYPNRLPAPSAGIGKHSMDVGNEGLVSIWQSVWVRELLCIGSVLQQYREWEK